jgi:predicted metal-dependent hydrolase
MLRAWTVQTLRSTQCQTAKESQQQAAQAALEHLTATVAELKARLDKSSPSPRADSAGAMHLFARDRK